VSVVLLLVLLVFSGCVSIVDEAPVYPSVVKEVGESVREVPEETDEVVSKTPFEEIPSPAVQEENPERRAETTKTVLTDEQRRWMEAMRKSRTAEMEKMQRLAMEARTKELSEAEKNRKKGLISDAEKLFKEGKYREAMSKYAEALRVDPLDREVLNKWFECYTLSGMRVKMPEVGLVREEESKPSEVPPDVAKKILLLEQKFIAAEHLFREGKMEEAKKKFDEVVQMILWEKEKIDRKGYLAKAREYLKRIEQQQKKEKDEE